MGQGSIQWVWSQLPFILFVAVQQQACIFLFPARLLAKFCYINRFVSARAEKSFSPSAALHQHHDGGGKLLPGVGGRQLRNHQHRSNLSPRVTKGTHMICKSSCDFILCRRQAGLASSSPGLHQTLSDELVEG